MGEILKTRLLVFGGGPGGYVAAIRAAQLGVETTLVEKDRLGGVCLIRGCIPSKAMIHAADAFWEMSRAVGAGRHGIRLPAPPELDLEEVVRWKSSVVDKLNGGVAALLKRHKVRVILGEGVFTDAKTCRVGDLEVRADTVILAAGSLPAALPHIPFGGSVISSTQALDLKVLPNRLVVVGAGYIGLELGTAFRKFGAAVTLVEAADRILPLYDAALTAPVAAYLKRAGIELRLNARAAAYADGALEIETAAGRETLATDRLLVAVGRRAHTQGYGLETMGVDMSGPFVKVDDHCRTSMSGVYAVGDLVGEPMLEHKAAAQGHCVAQTIAGQPTRFDPVAVAAVCFTEPEIVSAGLSFVEAEEGAEVVVSGVFPFAANGRALSMDAGVDGGFVRVVARARDHRILGLQAVGRHVSELAGQFALALEMGAVLEDVAGTIHAHPTLGEAVHEAALRALGHAVHI